MRALWAAALLSILVPPPGARAQGDGEASDDAFVPQVRPTLEVRRAPGPITLDGALDDPGWANAARATGFSENFPHEKARPPVESEVWVTYDDEYLYLAFVARDDPRTIRTSIVDRDQMWQDDYFGILLDTYGDAAWAYFIFANPSGVQGDSRFATAGGEDDGFDLVYRSEGQITDQGYQIEMAIPFKSLRFPDRPEQTWRATFWRTRPRGSRAQYTWAATSNDESCFLCEFGTLTGIRGVKPGGSLELFPSVTTSHSSELRDGDDPDSGFETDGLEGEAALGARYAFANGITAEATINPDFSQVESDVAQIDANTTFALFFPERRPFFQEGSDLFGTFFDVVYTRQINDPQVASKVIGRLGRTNVAYLVARDETSPILLPFEQRSFVGTAGRSVSNILRARRTFGDRSYVGGLITDRRLEDSDGAGTDYGIDGQFQMTRHYRLEYQMLGSRTVEPDDPSLTEDEDDPLDDLRFGSGHTAIYDGESYTGFAQYTSLEREARYWNFDFDYWASSPTFRADDGFEFRNDMRRLSMYQGVTFRPRSSWLDRVTPQVYMHRRWTFGGERRSDFLQMSVEANLKHQTFVLLQHEWDQEIFGGTNFSGIHRWFFDVESRFSEPVQAEFSISHGDAIARNEDPPILGRGSDIHLAATIRPTDRIVIEPSVDYSSLDAIDDGSEVFRGYILRTRTTFNWSRRLFTRLVVQFDDFDQRWNVEPLVTYKINPFTLFYVGSTQVYERFDEPRDEFSPAARQYFAKFQYLFQL